MYLLNYDFLCVYVQSRVAGSYGSFVFSILRTLPAVFHSGCISLHSHKQCRNVPLPSAAFIGYRWFFLLSLIGWWPYTAVLVSAVTQRDSAVSIHIFSAS